jgi:hypothetical protein
MALTLAWVLLAAPSPDIGSIYGKVNAPASFFLAETSSTYARRMALPHSSVRPPSGVLVALDGEPFAKEKFPLPTDEVRIEASKGGFDQRLVGCQTGAPIAVENLGDKPLKLKTHGRDELFKEPIAPHEKKVVVIADTGVFTLQDEANPEVTTAIVVTSNPFVLLLDETGEFLFDELAPGNYTVRVFWQNRWIAQVPAAVKRGERENLAIPLTRQSVSATDKKGDGK